MEGIKVCNRCGLPKSLLEFSLNHPSKQDGRLRPDCKECVRERNRDSYNKNKKLFKDRIKIVNERAKEIAKNYINEYLLSHPCVDCGEADPDVLDFDHVRGKKVCGISRMVGRGYRLWRIKAEIDKCEVRCANDHRRVTKKRRDAKMRV